MKKRVFKLAVKAGQLMMESGAEVHRVEDTVNRICRCFGMDKVETFATPTGLFVSVPLGGDDSDILCHVVRLKSSSIDLGRISQLNHLSRSLSNDEESLSQGLQKIEELSLKKEFPLPIRFLGASIISAFFCAMFSANLTASICALFTGFASYTLYWLLSKLNINYFVKGLCCCALTTALSLLIFTAGISTFFNAIIIGTMMIFVPGAAITNAIRDLLSGDMQSGLARMAEAFIVAVSLASGAGLVLKLQYLLRLDSPIPEIPSVPLALSIVLGFGATLGFAIIFHVPTRCLLAVSLTGGTGWFVHQLTLALENSQIMSIFISACFIGLASEILARTMKEANTVFAIPGIIPMVPGAGMYYTMFHLVSGNTQEAANKGTETLFLAGSIALGLLLVGSLTSLFFSIKRRRWKNP